MAAGALVAMPLTGQILDRRASGTVTRVATLLFCLLLPLPLIAPSPVVLGAVLFVFGAANGAMDVSMNAHGVAVERDARTPDHVLAARRLERRRVRGGRAGRGGGCRRARPARVGACVGVCCGCAAWWITARLGSASTHSARPGFALPSRGVLLIGALCFLAMVTEGAIGDWSGIYLRQDLGASAAAAATASPASRSGWRSRGWAGTGSTTARRRGAAARRDGAGRGSRWGSCS